MNVFLSFILITGSILDIDILIYLIGDDRKCPPWVTTVLSTVLYSGRMGKRLLAFSWGMKLARDLHIGLGVQLGQAVRGAGPGGQGVEAGPPEN